MGDEKIAENKVILQRLQEYETKKGYDYKSIMKEIQRKGTTDWEFKMQITFKENFLQALKDYENQPYYEELVKKIKNLNPTEFYETIKENNLIDFISAGWYKLDKDKYSMLINSLNIGSLEDYEYIGHIYIDF